MYRRQGWRCLAHRHPHSSVADSLSTRVNDAPTAHGFMRELPFIALGTADAVPHVRRCGWDTTDPIPSDVKLLHRRATTSSFDSAPTLPISANQPLAPVWVRPAFPSRLSGNARYRHLNGSTALLNRPFVGARHWPRIAIATSVSKAASAR